MNARPQAIDPRQILLQKYLERASARKRAPETIQRRQPGASVPISAEQKNLWLHASLSPEVPLYNEAFTIHRHGPCDRAVLERSLNEILRRHEIWRTAFAMRDGTLVQIVAPALRIELPLVDLCHLPEAERERAAVEMATADARQPFDLAEAPLLRARLVRLAPHEHRLYLTLHHIVFDGVSVYRVVVPELAALYDAYASGREPGLAPPELQYGDYAAWREGELARDDMARESAYWQRQLAGELPVLRLPADRARPAQPTYRGGMETFILSAATTAALKELSRTEGVTLYVLLLASFKALLHRYSGQDDIIVGGVTDMRRRPELAKVVGYFLNGLALRTRPAANLPFRDYLAAVQAAVIEALDASALPFDRVVRMVEPRRDPGVHPIFQVLFSVQPPPPQVDGGWDLTQMDVSVGAAKFDIYVELEERPGGIEGRFLYAADLFEAATIRRMIGHFQTILAGIAASPSCLLGRLPLLTPAEAKAMLSDWNATARDYGARTLPAWFAEQARKTPDAIALEHGHARWTYRQLDDRVAALTARLRRAGIERERLAAIMLERSADMVAALLATLRAGGAYLPLDPELPTARLELIMGDARPAVLVTERALLGRIPETAPPVILCEDADAAAERAGADPDIAPGDLAYVLYTSGSTGRPKAVEICHGALANLLAAMRDALEADARDSMLAVTTISFDIAALELFLPLVTGGRLIVASREDAGEPERIARLLRDKRCTIMQATPATWRGLVASGWPGASGLKILCGGEALQHDLAVQLLGRGEAVWNLYGPTETTIWSLSHKLRLGDESVPIGRPLANTRVYVLDRNGEPVPAGVDGELYIGGAGVARCYRNDPGLTAGKFVMVPAIPGERLYRTGDIVRFRSDGVVEFHGRSDNQVKVRGFRVGIEEVEAALAAHPDIAAVAVRAVPDASGEASLLAFVVPRDGCTGEQRDLRGFLGQALPRYMIPSRFVTVASLPMTANGKVDRARLPMPPQETGIASGDPRDALEQLLADLWAKLLGVRTVGITENFFDLGGHSLLAAMLVAEIARATGRELPLAALFRAPTIAALAALIRSSDPEPAFSHLVALRPEGRSRPLFIVHGIFGNVLQFRGLAERLLTDRPVYALQARGVDPRLDPHKTIAAMASAYIEEIRGLQPSGPYALAGYSFGGLIAFEMACRLQESGEAVEMLALLETDVHPRNLPLADWLRYQWSLASRVGRTLRTLRARLWPHYLLGKLGMIWHRALLRLGLTEPGDPPAEVPEAMSARNREMYRNCVREFIAYRPRRFAGRITAFRAAEPALDECDPLPVWRKVGDTLDVQMIAGTHGTIMDERNVDTLAFKLSACLAKVGTELVSSPSTACEERLGDGHTATA